MASEERDAQRTERRHYPDASYLELIGRYVWDVMGVEQMFDLQMQLINQDEQHLGGEKYVGLTLGAAATNLRKARIPDTEPAVAAWMTGAAHHLEQVATSRKKVLHAHAVIDGRTRVPTLLRTEYERGTREVIDLLRDPNDPGRSVTTRMPIAVSHSWVDADTIEAERSVVAEALVWFARHFRDAIAINDAHQPHHGSSPDSSSSTT